MLVRVRDKTRLIGPLCTLRFYVAVLERPHLVILRSAEESWLRSPERLAIVQAGTKQDPSEDLRVTMTVVASSSKSPMPKPLLWLWASPWTLVGMLIGGVGLLTGGGVQRRCGVVEFYGGWVRKFLERFPVHPTCLLYTSPSPRDGLLSRMPSSA